jgi:hypothetical protein
LRALAAIGMVFAVMGGGGCLFEPRSPQAPIDSDVEWLPPYETENVLANMESAVEARFLTNYKDSLDESFSFVPSLTDANEAPRPGYFDDFGKTRELAAIEKLFTQVDALALAWNLDGVVIEDNGTTYIYKQLGYTLTVSYANGDEVVYAGDGVELELEKFGSEWRVIRWDETGNSQLLTWGRLRGNLDV